MTYTTVDLLDSAGTGRKTGVDRLTNLDGAAAPTNADAQLVRPVWGPEGDVRAQSDANPAPVREGKFTSVLQTTSALTSSGTSQVLLASNSSRRKAYVSNGGTSGIWLNFGTSAVAGNGVYLPAKSKDTYETDMQITFILEASGTAGPVSAIGV